MKLISLTFFVLFQLTIVSIVNKSVKISKPFPLDNPVLRMEDQNNKNIKDEEISKSSKLLLSKTDYRTYKQLYNTQKPDNATNYSKLKKENKKGAIFALSIFLLGIISFLSSIHFICWNERRTVKEAELNDYIRIDKKSIFAENGKITEKDNNVNVFIVGGPVTVSKEAQLEEFPLEVTTSRGKIVVIKAHYERFSKIKRKDEEENPLFKKGENDNRNWYTTEYINNRFTTQFYYGEAVIARQFSFSTAKLDHLVELNQSPSLDDNYHIYRPTVKDIPVLEEYFKLENTDPDKPYIIFVNDPFIYILRSNIPTDHNFELNPFNYEFSESDLRLSLKFYYIPKAESYFTAVGRLSKPDENGLRFISAFETDITKSDCNVLCCCSAEEDDTNFQIDLLYTRRMNRDQIVHDLERNNEAYTWFSRGAGFIWHFLSLFVILYSLLHLIEKVPTLMAMGANVVVFYCFVLSLMSFLFLVALAWICTRPVYSVILFGAILIIFFIGKTTKEHLEAQENYNYNAYEYEYLYKDNDTTKNFLK